MRLQSIKLAGFKSFVDPLQISLPSNLIGVVGPNGCGKSNIIDAVRWVLGESRASALRGESMQDVIFNGTAQRKPVARASVELLFDNTQKNAELPAPVPGAVQWQQYSELAIKRILTRQGDSHYYINNHQVRRRDIQDIFLGTGLGSRSYAIVEQGMISRIIEAKPEELRVFLEEASGISRYKERRKETEARLQQAREHLQRTADTLRELNAQILRLEEQSAVARQYQALGAEHTQTQHLLWLLRYQIADSEQTAIAEKLAQISLQIDQLSSKMHQASRDVEETRLAHFASNEALHQAQAALYEANAEVGKIESDIERYKEQYRQQEQQHQEGLFQQSQLTLQLQSLAEAKESNTQHIQEGQVVLDTLAQQLAELRSHQSDVLGRVRNATAEFEHARTHQNSLEKQLEVQRTHLSHAHRQREILTERRAHLVRQIESLQAPPQNILEEREAQQSRLSLELAQVEQGMAQQKIALAQARETRDKAQEAWNTAVREMNHIDAQINALKSLQHQVQQGSAITPWLQKHQLLGLGRLWQTIKVDPGWEVAVEAVLRERLVSLLTEESNAWLSYAADAPPARVNIIAPVPVRTDPTMVVNKSTMRELLPASSVALRDKITVTNTEWNIAIDDCLAGCYTLDNLAEGLSIRHELPLGVRLVVAKGHYVDRHGIGFYAADNEQAGLLARSNDIDNWEKRKRAGMLHIDKAQQDWEQSKQVFLRIEAQSRESEQQITQLRQSLHQNQITMMREQEMLTRYQQTLQQLQTARADIEKQYLDEETKRNDAQGRTEQLTQEMSHTQTILNERKLALLAAQEAEVIQTDQIRTQERQVHEYQFRLRGYHEKQQQIEQSTAQVSSQQRLLTARLEQINVSLEQLSQIDRSADLHQSLERRILAERTLARGREENEQLVLRLREQDVLRMQSEQKIAPLQAQYQQYLLQEQAARLGKEQYENHLNEAQVDRVFLQTLLVGTSEESLTSTQSRLAEQIAGLGAVNLAAMDDLQKTTERQQFLEAQHQDLTTASSTLEEAIRQIDMETRERMGETFETVNRNLGELFRTLFNGGEARLVMTGREILDTGIQIMAQPPGKKNATIALLSGGEKALTATALVFALFRLNPAPFCLLDEVDAPLDDPNTERFCRLVKSMSEDTQFVFVTHNKVAMEMATHLIGITQEEPGVSRTVAVDMSVVLS